MTVLSGAWYGKTVMPVLSGDFIGTISMTVTPRACIGGFITYGVVRLV